MSDDPDRIENAPYFKWRRDGAIQTTLGLAAASVVLTCAGFDTISAFAHQGSDHRIHLLILAAAALLGGSIAWQFRFVVLVLAEICGCAVFLGLTGFFLRPSPLAATALIAAVLAGLIAIQRTRYAHWSDFRTYCRSPEIIPRAERKP